MTIDEAIKEEQTLYDIAKDKYEKLGIKNCLKRMEEHKQYIEWLEELKDCRDKNKMVVRIDVENMDSIKDKIEELSKYAESQYNKAVDESMDESAKAICIGCGYLDGHICKYKGGNCSVSKPMLEVVAKALGKLKAGGENERM